MSRILRAVALTTTLAALASCDSAGPLASAPDQPRFTTGAAFPAPAGFTATPPTATSRSVVLNWSDLPGDQMYLVQWRKGETGTWKTLVSTGANRETYTTDSLSTAAPNYYRVAGMTPDFQVGEWSTVLLRPTAITTSATLTSDTTAALKGFLGANGSVATWWFEWGTDPSLAGAAQTPAQQSSAGQTMTQTIPVVPGNVYYFRLAASNAAGTTYGQILHFNAGPPAEPTGFLAQFVAQPEVISFATYTAAHHVRIQWTHDGTDVYRFRPQRRLVGSENWVQVADLGGGSRGYIDESFPVSTERVYDYRVLACNQLGQCSSSGIIRVTTPGLPAPSGLTATRTADGKVALAWQDLATEESYLVQWRVGDSGTWQTLFTPGKNASSAVTASVTAGVTNYYRVAGEVKSFRTGAFAEASVAAGAGQSTQAQTGAFTLPSSATAALSGAVTPNGLATTAWIEWGTDPSLATFSQAASKSVGSGTSAVTFTDTVAVTAGQTYYYRAAASNSAGTVRGAIKSFLAGPPAAAAVNAAFSLANYRITVSWTHSGVGTPAFFRVDRRATGGTTWTEVSGSASPGTYVDTNFPANAARSYDYRVRACNAANECTASSVATVATQPLAAPAGLTAQASGGNVTLAWGDITGETDYLVQWRTDPSAPWKTLVSTSANATGYTTASATPGVTNYYRVAGEASGFRTGVFAETSVAVP